MISVIQSIENTKMFVFSASEEKLSELCGLSGLFLFGDDHV